MNVEGREGQVSKGEARNWHLALLAHSLAKGSQEPSLASAGELRDCALDGGAAQRHPRAVGAGTGGRLVMLRPVSHICSKKVS